MNGHLAFAFLAGTVATANPCGFALLPAYLARQLGTDRGDPRVPATVARALLVGAITTAGFLVVFGTVGTGIALGARVFTRAIPWAALAIGVVLLGAGVAVLAGRRLPVRVPAVRAAGKEGHVGVLLFGVAYGTASLSCTLPIFLAVVGAALTRGPLDSALAFAAYAGGMGTLLTALAVAAALSRSGLASATRRALPYVSRLSGLLLAAAGAYVVYYWSVALLGLSGASKPVQVGNRLSATLQTWLGGETGQAVVVALAAAVSALVVWAMLRALDRSRRAAATPRQAAPMEARRTE